VLLVSGALVRKKGSFHSSEGWLEKLEEWVSMHNMNTIELPSADCEAKQPENFKKTMHLNYCLP